MFINFSQLIFIFIILTLYSKQKSLITEYKSVSGKYSVSFEFDLSFIHLDFKLPEVEISLTKNYTWILDKNNTIPEKVFDFRFLNPYGVYTYEDDHTGVSRGKGAELVINATLFEVVPLFGFKIVLGAFKHSDLTLDHCVGFGLHYSDENYSVVHLLKRQLAIDKRQFTFSPLDEVHQNGTLYLGKFQNGSKLEKEQNKFKCFVGKGQYQWGCELKSVAFPSEEEVYENKYEVVFAANHREIFVPIYFYDFLEEKLFKKEIEKNRCYWEYLKKKLYLACDREVPLEYEMEFRFASGEKIRIPMKKFAHFRGDGYQLEFVYMDRSDRKWIFGTSFLKHFTSVFDFDERSITLYYKDFVEEKKVSRSIKVFLFIIIVLLFAGTLFIAIVKNRALKIIIA